MWKEEEEDWEEETDQDDNDLCSMDICNDLHRVKDSCRYQSFNDNANYTNESQCWVFEHEAGKYQDCPNG